MDGLGGCTAACIIGTNGEAASPSNSASATCTRQRERNFLLDILKYSCLRKHHTPKPNHSTTAHTSVAQAASLRLVEWRKPIHRPFFRTIRLALDIRGGRPPLEVPATDATRMSTAAEAPPIFPYHILDHLTEVLMLRV